MEHVIDIVKRSGKRPNEPFEQDKLHRSIKSALFAVGSPDGLAHDTADRVCSHVVVWLEGKPTVTSDDLRRKASEALDTLHPEAAHLYKHYKTII